jgi:hypothetical protein
MQWHKEGVR